MVLTNSVCSLWTSRVIQPLLQTFLISPNQSCRQSWVISFSLSDSLDQSCPLPWRDLINPPCPCRNFDRSGLFPQLIVLVSGKHICLRDLNCITKGLWALDANEHGLSFPHKLHIWPIPTCNRVQNQPLHWVPLDHYPICTPLAGCHYLCRAVALAVNLAQAADQNDELSGLALELRSRLPLYCQKCMHKSA